MGSSPALVHLWRDEPGGQYDALGFGGAGDCCSCRADVGTHLVVLDSCELSSAHVCANWYPRLCVCLGRHADRRSSVDAGAEPGGGSRLLLTGPATNVTTFGVLRDLHGNGWPFSLLCLSGFAVSD